MQDIECVFQLVGSMNYLDSSGSGKEDREEHEEQKVEVPCMFQFWDILAQLNYTYDVFRLRGKSKTKQKRINTQKKQKKGLEVQKRTRIFKNDVMFVCKMKT